MAWIKKLAQPLLFLKLDFSKAYDMVKWEFLDFFKKFNFIVQMLFINTKTYVKIKISLFEPFIIEREIKQRYLLAS